MPASGVPLANKTTSTLTTCETKELQEADSCSSPRTQRVGGWPSQNPWQKRADAQSLCPTIYLYQVTVQNRTKFHFLRRLMSSSHRAILACLCSHTHTTPTTTSHPRWRSKPCCHDAERVMQDPSVTPHIHAWIFAVVLAPAHLPSPQSPLVRDVFFVECCLVASWRIWSLHAFF
jgi:hypothetical protein